MLVDQYGKEIGASNHFGEIGPRMARHIEKALYTLGKEKPLPWMPVLVDRFGRWIARAGAPKTITFRRYKGIEKTRQL